MSNIYPNRGVPDLSGLVGLGRRPSTSCFRLNRVTRSTWVTLARLPNGDETANNDGWAAFSGTSAAAPQLAGVAALVKQACPKLTPNQVKEIMMKTARDVTTGNCNGTALNPGGIPSVVGPDASTGNGLVDAYKAVLAAKIQCLGPITPITIRPPITPITPITIRPPITPITPITPIPIQPPIPSRPSSGHHRLGHRREPCPLAQKPHRSRFKRRCRTKMSPHCRT